MSPGSAAFPRRVNGDAVRMALLNDFNIEIGTSFGQLHGKIWRIGTMGYNARRDCVLATIGALDVALAAAGHKFTRGAGPDAAYQSYLQCKICASIAAAAA